MKYLVLTLRGPGFNPDVIPAHYEFLDGLRHCELLEQAGPFTDKTGGAYVLITSSLNEAVCLAEQDPLHARNCSTVVVREWDVRG